jgi:hypothetical protein
MADQAVIDAITQGFSNVASLLGSGKLSSTGNSGPASASNAGGLNPALANTTGQFQKNLQDIGGQVPGLVLGLNKLTTGTDTSKAALDFFASGLTKVGLGEFGKIAQLAGGSIVQWKEQLDASAREFGVGNNNLGLFVKQAADAGLTTKQFSDILQQTGVQSAGLGGSAQKGAAAFTAIAKEVQQSPLGIELQNLGMSTQELASITAISAIANKSANLSTKDAAAAAEQLAMQLDETSRLTGVSRDQLAKTLKADEDRIEVQMYERTLSEEQAAGYAKMKSAATELGGGMEQLTTEIASGKFSEAGRAQFAALGTAGSQYEQALREQMAITKNSSQAEKDKANADMAAATEAVKIRISSKQYAEEGYYASGKLRDAYMGLADTMPGYRNGIKAATDANGDYAAGQKQNKDEIAKLRAGQTPDGKPDTGQNLTRLLNEANQGAITQAKGFANNLKDINDQIKPGTPAYKALTSYADMTSGGSKTGEESAAKQKGTYDKTLETVNTLANPASAIPAASQSSDSSGRIKSASERRAEGQRGTGTLGETGSAIEPADAIVKIHKGETVLDPAAVKNLGKSFNISEISKTIDTTISSSGGGSTTTSRVQNDDSKSAEKELNAVREQMQAEKNALREQLKAKIGDGSKLGGNAVAKEMRTGDEGTAIAEKYKAMMEPLQKQIDAGISFETTKKASAIEETKKVVEEHNRITFSGNAKQLEAFKFKEKAEDDFYGVSKKQTIAELADQTAKRDEIFKAAEAARSIVGTSMQGLSDDAIQAMIPVGASMDDFYIDMNDNLQSFSNDSANNLKKVTDNEQASSTIKISASEAARKVTEDMGLKSIESVGVAGKAQEEYHSQFTESQKKIIDDYKGYSEENRSFHAKAMEKGAKEDAETAQMIGERIIKMKADIGDRQATTEEAAAIRNEELNKEMFEKQVASKKEMQDVMENLNEYSVAREKELKQQAAQDISSIQDEATTAKIDEAKSTMAKAIGTTLDMPGSKFPSREEAEKNAKKTGENGFASEQLNKITTGFGEIKSLTVGGGDMFNPTIINQKAADAQKAKIAEIKASEAKKSSEAIPKKTEAEAKKEAEAKAEAAKKTESAKKEEPKAADAKQVTMKDLNDQLIMLNRHMIQLINHSEKSADANSKTAKATQKATGVR